MSLRFGNIYKPMYLIDESYIRLGSIRLGNVGFNLILKNAYYLTAGLEKLKLTNLTKEIIVTQIDTIFFWKSVYIKFLAFILVFCKKVFGLFFSSSWV